MIRVTAAILSDDRGRVLVARRGPGRHLAGFWEFPGGKMEPGESPQACLARELAEELGIHVQIGDHIVTCTHSDEKGPIELTAFVVHWTPGPLVLKDHDAVDWIEPERLLAVDLCPADLPVARAVASRRS